jgi:tRNA modification GTPase
VLSAFDPEDTIAAMASPSGSGLRGIIRLSGPNAWRIALDGFQPEDSEPLPRSPRVVAGVYRLPGLRPTLPASVALWPGPRTYTGQELAEIHAPGSPPLLSLLLAHCLDRGARHAQPGEFTLRAFLSGRIDLTRAEAVLGVIDARNQGQLDAALEQLAGGLSTPITALRERLLDLLAHLEANLDFVDEADVDPLGRAALADELDEGARTLDVLADRLGSRDRAGGQPRIVLAGPPNAGKSRLFNALMEGEHAIVSPRAGTTRDYLTGLCECDGLLVELVDTAGVETPADAVSAQAQKLRADETDRADLVLLCASVGLDEPVAATTTDADRLLRVWTKSDLGPPTTDHDTWLPTSAEAGEGIAALRSSVARAIRGQHRENDLATTTSVRCRDSLVQAAAALRDASATIVEGGGDELVALDLRLSLDELGKVTGAIVADDVLDRIFRRFCIGK